MAATTPKVDPAQTLAAHVIGTGLEDVRAASLMATRCDVLDTFGCMLGGSGAPGIKELTAVTGRWGGKEEASLAVLGGKIPSHHAALVNSAMGHALDFDDTFDQGGHIHPGTSALAASLAVGESLGGVTGGELMLAVTLGLDVSCRLAHQLEPGTRVEGLPCVRSAQRSLPVHGAVGRDFPNGRRRVRHPRRTISRAE